MARGRFAGYYRRSGYYGRFSAPSGELKFHDLDIDDATVAANGTIAEDSCVGIAQGTGESQRIGRKVTIRSLFWRYHLQLPTINAGTSTAVSDVVRVVVYQDSQTNGAAAAVTDILETDNYQSFNNLANSGRFKILYDKQHVLNYTALGSDGTTMDAASNMRTGSFYKKCNIPIEYSSTTGAITELRTNNIGVLLLSRNGVCEFESKMRLRYSDN